MNPEIKYSSHDKVALGFNLLKIIPPDLKVFDNISCCSSQETDLSGPFSDFEENEALNEKKSLEGVKKTDMYTYFSFSQEFKLAMESLKKEMKGNATENENINQVEYQNPVEDSTIHLALKKNAEEMLRHKEIDFFLDNAHDNEPKTLNANWNDCPTSTKSNTKVSKNSKKTIDKKKNVSEEDEKFHETMSGYWRMLAAYDEFQISPPHYDAYANEKPHWLETKPIPFEVTENSRRKCLEWLENNFEH